MHKTPLQLPKHSLQHSFIALPPLSVYPRPLLLQLLQTLSSNKPVWCQKYYMWAGLSTFPNGKRAVERYAQGRTETCGCPATTAMKPFDWVYPFPNSNLQLFVNTNSRIGSHLHFQTWWIPEAPAPSPPSLHTSDHVSCTRLKHEAQTACQCFLINSLCSNRETAWLRGKSSTSRVL